MILKVTTSNIEDCGAACHEKENCMSFETLKKENSLYDCILRETQQTWKCPENNDTNTSVPVFHSLQPNAIRLTGTFDFNIGRPQFTTMITNIQNDITTTKMGITIANFLISFLCVYV